MKTFVVCEEETSTKCIQFDQVYSTAIAAEEWKASVHTP